MKRFTFLVLMLCVALNSAFAQMDIKKIIFDDLLALNDLYDGCIIQFSQVKRIVNNSDTIKQVNTLVDLLDSSDSRVFITKIDSVGQYFYIEARFDLLSKAPYFGLFTENTFNYVLYKENSKYYRINGFLVSEILYTTTPLDLMKSYAKIKAPNRFKKHLGKRDVSKIRNYLYVSVMSGIRALGFNFCDKPYVKDVVCF